MESSKEVNVPFKECHCLNRYALGGDWQKKGFEDKRKHKRGV